MSGLFDLTDRVAVVSGAAQGLGKAMALGFAEHGAHVAIVDLNADGLAQTAAQISALGRRALPITCDVSDPARIPSIFSAVDREFRRLDILGNVAGDAVLGRPEEIRLDDVERTWRNIVLGRFCMCREAGFRMLQTRRGSIINVGSIASTTALGRGHIAYSMAMGAVAQMTRELSTEWAARGTRVNAILPAQVVNPGLSHRISEDPQLLNRFLGGIPAGRLGRPDDIRGVSVFLASDASSWITGALIPMDGGNLAINASATIGKS